MRRSKYTQKIKPLLKRPFFTSHEAKQYGIPAHALAYFANQGVIKRICPGIFSPEGYEPKIEFQWENLALIASSIPKSVICLISALCYYDLTDQIMRDIWIAIPIKLFPPKRPHTKIIRMRNMTLGKTKIKMGEYKVQIFDRERCIVDAFRHLSKEIALKALQKYLQSKVHKPHLQKLTKYAKILHVDLYPYILSYTT